MKHLLRALSILIVAGIVTPLCFAFTNNEIQPGATGSATPTSVGTSTPVPVLHCPTAPNQYHSIIFQVIGGTLGTDGCYFMPASPASPCAAASPAPSAANKVGFWVPTGGTPPSAGTTISAPSTQQGTLLSSINVQWDGVCTAASMSVSRTTLP